MPYCSVFTQRIVEFEASLSGARGLLEGYRESGRPETVEQVKDKLARLAEDRRTFVQGEYIDGVKSLLRYWGESSGVEDILCGENGKIFIGEIVFASTPTPLHYFPHIISRIGEDFQVDPESENQNLDFLEEIDGTLDFRFTQQNNNTLQSMKRLRRIGGLAHLENIPALLTFPSLEEIGGAVVVPDITDFRAIFPKLKHVGMTRGRSFVLSNKNDALRREVKRQIESLRQEGTLEFDGRIIL